MIGFVRRSAMTMVVTAVLVFGGLLAIDHTFEDVQADGEHRTFYIFKYDLGLDNPIHLTHYVVTQPQPPQPSEHHTVYIFKYDSDLGSSIHLTHYRLR